MDLMNKDTTRHINLFSILTAIEPRVYEISPYLISDEDDIITIHDSFIV